ncbi:hypothetical protein MBM_02215 [Drepanopeziza brunnea f. sp. 'multigermtubi' MB_m1]|uniref:Uncharacterized protein n=1 Tax=Marssonina brunnea f. sp. multigermtubi (strain MB_m1) TaxID=1072389 RepID=K1XHM6_MARBU|nr:uncharacterized protein MBM_02215 [Drepanopeziza brunnea f. sp. 'multigermtubi' MB_m1]EKD20263.1 hypothetical protein MBM_02215 [Drepanopeziza brunnea f. sp. 'multigermtubi' MB_m1]
MTHGEETKEISKEIEDTDTKELEKELRAMQRALRLGLRDDRSLANKLYSAYKNVPKTIIARMNPAFTLTAAVANIRRAIAFATKSLRLPAKPQAKLIPTILRTSTSALFKAANKREKTATTSQING